MKQNRISNGLTDQCACDFREGFALVVTLSLMVLLSILAVGLLSLSAISLRSESSGDARRTANANARMALTMAIGQLQKAAGPDQRITAPASMVDKDIPLGFTGAWRAWSRGEEGKDYEGKNSKFLGWLASSSLNETQPDPSKPPHVSPDDKDSVILLGKGTIRQTNTVDSKDPRIAVRPVRVVGKTMNGHVGWVTMDENVKSRVNLSAESTLAVAADRIARAGSPGSDGIQVIDGLEGFTSTKENVVRMVTLGCADLQLRKNVMGQSTNAISAWSASLLTNPVEGGLKKDLSSLFTRGLTAKEKAIRIFGDAGLPSGESDPYLGNLASYHNQYTKIGQPVGGIAPEADGISASVPVGFDPSPYDARSRLYLPKPQALKESILAPSVLRVDIIFSLVARDVSPAWAGELKPQGRQYMLHMMYLPVVVLHNPYNVPLTFDSVKVTFQDIPIGFQFMVNGQPLTRELVPLNNLYTSYDAATPETKNFGITLKTALGSNAPPIKLLPGQTRLFGTPKVPPDWTWNQEQSGLGADGVALFDWNPGRGFTSNFEMVPTLISPPSTSCGFDVDWLAPTSLQTVAGKEYGKLNSGGTRGIVGLRGTEKIGVRFGPVAPQTANNAFAITTEVKTNGKLVKCGAIRVNYESAKRLQTILEEGSSLRFPDSRRFPEEYPKLPDDPVVTVSTIYEADTNKVSGYQNPDPFVIFSISGKTTKESFVAGRPFADGTPSTTIAKIDFGTNKDTPGDVPLEMVMMPIRGGSSVIEEIRFTEEGFFFGGHSQANGAPRATFFEVPQLPLQSLAQFRHANLGNTGFHPSVSYTVGESLASPFMETSNVTGSWPADRSEMLDKTWLSNAALWDRYFFSTIAPQIGPAFGPKSKSTDELLQDFFGAGGKLLNHRLMPELSGDSVENVVRSMKEDNGWLVAAAHLLVEGGFNVNSVSVEAWTSVLSALRDKEIQTANGFEAKNKNEVSFPRVRRPSEGDMEGEDGAGRQRRWQGFRKLSDSQVRTLAENLVAENRARGPFLSLSEFVNRRLDDSKDDRSLRGAIQAAIRKSKLNDSISQDGLELDTGNLGSHKYLSPEAALGNNAVFAPGSLSQGDVMSVIGSYVTVRGDTFRIRCYGDATDNNGRVLARAWCEAIVQRLPDFVDPLDSATTETNKLNPANAEFGRRFQIRSFRWLGADEV